MSDLYDRVQYAVTAAGSDPAWDVLGALRAAIELHAPRNCRDFSPCSMRHEHLTCRWCSGYAWPVTDGLATWPCPTIAAIAEALGVQTGATT